MRVTPAVSAVIVAVAVVVVVAAAAAMAKAMVMAGRSKLDPAREGTRARGP